MTHAGDTSLAERVRALEEELKRVRAEAARQEKERARDMTREVDRRVEERTREFHALTRTLSHDLRTPLVAVAGFSNLLQRRLAGNPDPKIAEYLVRLKDAVEWSQVLVNDLVELLRASQVRPKPATVRLDDLSSRVLSVVTGMDEGRNVRYHVESGMPSVRADEHLLRRVLENLARNAVRCLQGRPDPFIRVEAEQKDGKVLVCVSDNGPGIDPEHRDRIFDPFVRLDTRGEGSGLGLAIARRFVELHGGEIWLESSEKDFGSRFCFTLPPGDDA